ncbi:unnamed protein product [Rotaria socialis]|uniref:peptide-O-fucosyltransferase n=1 Tax=Rotaria socialis TaxID=392032 RepID=A0A821MGA0_9BILA|nr:unnamed protein product [Rotaria socialis]CAF4769247.1 unnamed protein product [Rotaria socialis]
MMSATYGIRWMIFMTAGIILFWNYILQAPLSNFAENNSVEFGKYWLIEHLNEQLGKAKFHLFEQVVICNLLNRTLILPNVENSEIGLRLRHSFDYYYQPDSLTHITRALSSVEFTNHIKETTRKKELKAVLVFIGDSSCPSGNSSWDNVHSAIFKHLSRKFIVIKLRPLCFLTSYGWNPPVLPDAIVSRLAASYYDTDIVVAIKQSPFFLMDPNKLPVHVLKHNQTLIDMAEKFSEARSPYLAIHWRMEGGDENGVVCAHTLLKTVTTIRNTSQFKNIYFATDHRLPSERLLSNSYENSRADQTSGYWQVMETLKPLTFRNVSSFLSLTDSGALSIVEKLVCLKSDFFLPGYVPCDRNGAFGREMVRIRQMVSRKPWLYWSDPLQTYEPEKFHPS